MWLVNCSLFLIQFYLREAHFSPVIVLPNTLTGFGIFFFIEKFISLTESKSGIKIQFKTFLICCCIFRNSLSFFFCYRHSTLKTWQKQNNDNSWIFTAGIPPIFLPVAPRDFPELADAASSSSSS